MTFEYSVFTLFCKVSIIIL